MRKQLAECAKLIRSKNAGPFWLTIDVMFEEPAVYRCVRDQDVLNPGLMAQLFKQAPDRVRVFNHDAALAIKVSFPRSVSSGSPEDSDVFGGQQYAPILGLTVELPDMLNDEVEK